MKQQILDVLKNTIKPLSIIELTSKLKINTHLQQEEMLSDLEELKDNSIILENDCQEFYLEKGYNKFLVGVIQITMKGSGFIKIFDSDKEYRVNPNNTNHALNNDEVLFTLISNEEAIVNLILKRNTTTLVGTIVVDENTKIKTLSIQNKNFHRYKVHILNEEQAIENNIVVAKINNFHENSFTVTIEKVLGNLNDPGVDILSVIYEIGIKPQFEPETLIAANAVSQTVSEIEKRDRIDLRNEILVTIDGKDAKDFDDAICVYKLRNGNYRLIVAIADVSHYVQAKSPLDNEAFIRSTSVYLADRVIPMLPTQLSNGICSLNEQVERLCFVCDMEINSKGFNVSSRIYQGVMKSVRRMNYDEVNEAYHGKNPKFVSSHPQVWTMLQEARKLYQILVNYKFNSGVIDFDIDEAKIIIDDQGKVTDIKLRTRDISEKLIESFMIRANETVANKVNKMKLPFVYRVHEPPRKKKLSQITTILKLTGIQANYHWEKLHSKDLQILLDSLKDLPNFQVLSTLLLRSMEKARYSNVNIGHFGLASDCYTHFTSPIRRYPDLIVHRLLRQYLVSKDFNSKTIAKNQNFTALVAEQSSNMEVKAMECERSVEQMKKAEYMNKFINQKFSGIISAITVFGVFVELPNTIEGLIKLSDMQDDFYIFNEKAMVLFGERKRKQYRLGQTVDIIVKNANKKNRTIDFIFADTNQKNNKNWRIKSHSKKLKFYDNKKRKNKR
ncbi:MAG: ribonuclease R [Spiroplasma sp.]